MAHASSLLPVTATRGTSPAPLQLLFVCTANISRSPYAERRAAHLLRELGAAGDSVTVESAGIPGYPGRDMDAPMAAQLRRRGGDPTDHVSRVLTTEMLALADVVVTFEFAQADADPRVPSGLGTQAVRPAPARRCRRPNPGGATGYRLVYELQLAAAPDSMSWDVTDPYGRGASAAHQTADAIDGALSVIVPALVGLAPGRIQPPGPGRPRQLVPGLRVVLGRKRGRGNRRSR